MSESVKVYQAINAVTAELAKVGIAKERKNQQQGYAFRGIDDVYPVLAPLLSQFKLVIAPRFTGRTITTHSTQKGTNIFNVVVEGEFDIVSAEDGSKHTCRMYGEAMDTADKATNKAMSAAYKYLAFQLFCIPTEGENDADFVTHPETLAKGPSKPATRPVAAPAVPQRPPPQTPQAAPVPPKPTTATEKTRGYMLEQLSNVPRELLKQFFITKGFILPTEDLSDWSLSMVPMSNQALDNLRAEFENWVNEDPGPEPDAGGSEDSGDAELQPWYLAIVPVPRKGMKRDEYIKTPDTIGGLYKAMKGGDEDAGRRLWGFVNMYEPKGWKDNPPSQTDVRFRKDLDAFKAWHDAKHPPEQDDIPM